MPGGGSKKGERRGGRKKGTPNKVTGDLKSMILGALKDAGGKKYLLRQAEDNPGAFMALLGKCMPKEVSGPDGGPIETKSTVEAGPGVLRVLSALEGAASGRPKDSDEGVGAS